MQQWFRKGNARRFHRVDMPVRYFIVPSSPLEEREIYATGADYFPSTTQDRVNKLKYSTTRSLSKVQEQKELITQIVNEIIFDIEVYGDNLKKVTQGIHPKRDPLHWLELKQKLAGFKNLNLIEKSSPKTYSYFKLIEEKYVAFLQILINSIDQSDRDNFEVKSHLPVGFKLDETMNLFQNEKFSKIPLIQTILYLARFLDAYQSIHQNINDDNYLQHIPQEWPLQEVNLSASGVALLMPKLLKLYSRVDVFLYFEHRDKTIKFDGTVVDIRKVEDMHMERIAMNFEFPNGNDQDFIQQEIQKQEVKQCMKYTFF